MTSSIASSLLAPLDNAHDTARADAAIRRRLAAGPAGPNPMVEAAYAWHELRPLHRTPQPAQRTSAATSPRHLPIAHTGDALVADRLARILSALTWPIVAPVGDAEQTRYRIQVPAVRYHVVTRALNKAWRQAQAQFCETAELSGADTPAAVALWRMALLISGPGPRMGALNIRVATHAAGEMLRCAGTVLGVEAFASGTGRGAPTLIVCRRPDMVRLLAITGAGPASAPWVTGLASRG